MEGLNENSYPTFNGFQKDGSFSLKEWRKFWGNLTATQQKRIEDKAHWEQCSRSAVLYEWPSILEGIK